jgi:ABC-type glycerol-3-phosphate transport system substrate-binding protein
MRNRERSPPTGSAAPSARAPNRALLTAAALPPARPGSTTSARSPPATEGDTIMRSTWIFAAVVILAAGVAAYWLLGPTATKGPSEPALTTGGDSTGQNPPAAKAQLNWMARWKGEHDRETFVREVAREFEFLNPDIALNFKFHQDVGLPTEKAVAPAIVDMIKTGNIRWDVVPFNTGTYRDVAQLLGDPHWGHKYLVDFTEIDWFARTQKPFITENPMYRAPFDGMLVGPYIEGFYCMLWYNKDVADRVGLTIDPHAVTIDDLTGYVRAVYDYNQTHGTNIVAIHEAKDWRTTEYLFRHLFASAVGDLDELKERTASESKRAALLRTFQALERLGQYAALGDSYNDNVWWDTRRCVLDGRALFFVNGSWMYSHWMDIDEAKTMKMMPAELPVFQPVNFYIGSYTPEFAIMKASPNREAAIRLFKFWSQPKVAEKWVRYAKAPTGLRGHLTESDVADDQFERFQRQMNDKYHGNLYFSDDVGFILGEQNKLLTSLVNEKVVELLAGTTTAQEAYDAIMAECQ